MTLLIPPHREPEQFGKVIGFVTTPERQTLAVVEPFNPMARMRALSVPGVSEPPESQTAT